MVLAPSTAISFNFCRRFQTRSPLRRIFSSSVAVLRTIIWTHRLPDLPEDFARRIVTRVHLFHTMAARLEILQHRPGLPLVGLQPSPDHRFTIVIPDHQLLAVLVAHFVALR